MAERTHVVIGIVALLFLAQAACVGEIGDRADGAGAKAGPPPVVDPTTAGAPTFRRLTLGQYQSSVRALLGDVPFSPDLAEVKTQLDDDGEYTTVAAAHVGYAQSDVEALYASAFTSVEPVFADTERRAALVGCEPTADDDPCLAAFIERFGRRAFRRPLSEVETQRWLSVVHTAASNLEGDLWAGIEHAVAGIIQSPAFLWIPEVGEPAPDGSGRRLYTGWEISTRLAFALTGTAPDDELLDAAEAGELADAAGVRAQADRLIETDAGRAAVVDGLFKEYFDLDGLGGLGKDPTLYPQWTPSVAAAMREEAERVIEHAVFVEDADFATLFESRTTFVNAELAAIYGLPPPEGGDFAEVEIPGNWDRVGLLGLGAFLALNAKVNRSSPTLRGRFIRQRVLCQPISPPPPGVKTEIDMGDPASGPQTMKEKLKKHRDDPACAGCHDLMDPPGLTLEHFDAIGAFRTTDNGLELDVSGELDGKSFDGSVGLAETLAASPAIQPCLARQTFRYLAGQKEDYARASVLEEIGADSEGSVRRLLVGLAASDLFRYFVPAE